jgi:thymidylate synthase
MLYKSFCNERLKIHEKIVKENPTCDFQPWEETISKEEFINKIKTDEQFALKWGNMGPIYGMQWRHFGGKQRSTKVNDSGRANRMEKCRWS